MSKEELTTAIYAALRLFKKDLYKDATVIIIFSWLISFIPFFYDDSDPEWPKKSGLIVFTDNLTGCQYLSNGKSIIKRLDEDGNQICNTSYIGN